MAPQSGRRFQRKEPRSCVHRHNAGSMTKRTIDSLPLFQPSAYRAYRRNGHRRRGNLNGELMRECVNQSSRAFE